MIFFTQESRFSVSHGRSFIFHISDKKQKCEKYHNNTMEKELICSEIYLKLIFRIQFHAIEPSLMSVQYNVK
ncbi:hypothetical cytosolic protein [Syntrophus aciditrophicus SB]|uniref:Hypothetical cytosolic protein n=1 Tax=Syntrophus aciditrophicus (strain SB) TaxID=56780 RepID=Q2LTD2_SYNAS|nr:hypothetical cytosolic protein [Syntrophus aciditrophicus SB]